jgi:hypothetical protein
MAEERHDVAEAGKADCRREWHLRATDMQRLLVLDLTLGLGFGSVVVDWWRGKLGDRLRR